ncbi:DUF433 domain-containing protein [cf. Phormidesmis sp. LEGE 11477]|uniref:DUF433 domain-containing protein n=1 Tax=cf. Phormidesmis sp. LEGE 11477 TaxID=1828680 RepID=UPI00188194B0|nr:DUF433 domain-containing protein [cf. Phormidesmis sp. LEGE 11477]MBE9064020.1 DUF433 domain-containing protein [cf. Phormidesmis sp. LEGE 11477]
MDSQYVEQRDAGYWIAHTRISLDSVVVAFLQGLTSETIAAECFPSLSLEQVYGAIAYYLGHRDEIDAYLQQADSEFAVLREATREQDRPFYEKLMQARRAPVGQQ